MPQKVAEMVADESLAGRSEVEHKMFLQDDGVEEGD